MIIVASDPKLAIMRSSLFLMIALPILLAAQSRLPAPSELILAAREQFKRTARVPLTADPSARTPNFVRALALTPKAQEPMAKLFEQIIYAGAVEPELKLAIGLRIAQIYNSPYLAAHMEGRLRSTSLGRELIASFKTGVPPAVRYGDALTRDIHGVTNAQFTALRANFNDAQIVELTTTTCFLNYLVRFVEALTLPVEPWALGEISYSQAGFRPPTARIAMLRSGPIPSQINSMRAMFLHPEGAQAWRDFGAASREYASVDRPLKLHISFAVSLANGCRYCTVHQVVGLRRAGVDPAKLLAMKKDDSQLTPRELAAVSFARKLTRAPGSITDADYAALRQTFGEQGALEVVMQTANFAFMNRFTDGLRLPSEDEGIHLYEEVYGAKSYSEFAPLRLRQ